jgi:hypothetical protein
MSDFNEDLLMEINLLRTNPKKYAKTISKYMNYFKGNLLCLPDTNAGIQTEEGVEAFKEAVDFLNNQEKLEPLKPSKGLCRIAEEFIAIYQKPDSGELANKDMEDIINKYGSFSGSFSRAMDFGGETAEMAIINLVVSDGDQTRGQRESLLSTDIKKVGVANGDHEVYRHCSAIITSTEFDNTFDKDDNGLLTPSKPANIKNKENKEKINNDDVKINNSDEKKEGKNENDKKNEGIHTDKKKNNNGKEELPFGVASINKTEKIVVENGDKKKVTKIIKVMEDGSQRIETVKEILDE